MLNQNPDVSIDRLLKLKRKEILQLAAKHGAYKVRIFGSVARGEADANSDVDFLVEVEPDRSLFDLGGLARTVGLQGRCCPRKRITSANSRTGFERGNPATRNDREKLRDSLEAIDRIVLLICPNSEGQSEAAKKLVRGSLGRGRNRSLSTHW